MKLKGNAFNEKKAMVLMFYFDYIAMDSTFIRY